MNTKKISKLENTIEELTKELYELRRELQLIVGDLVRVKTEISECKSDGGGGGTRPGDGGGTRPGDGGGGGGNHRPDANQTVARWWY